MAIISVSGRIGSGKDTVGKISQIIIDNPHFTDKTVEKWLDRELPNPKFKNKKWADSLKNILCMLINSTRDQLEDREFKEAELGEEWWYYKIKTGVNIYKLVNYLDNNMSEDWIKIATPRYLIKPTPRLLLQLIGTECGRNIIHPNIWVNSLMSEYKSSVNHCNCFATTHEGCSECLEYPNWIITDTRFPNELKAVKDKGGVSIKVVRPTNKDLLFNPGLVDEMAAYAGIEKPREHESETALDNAEFDETIINDGNILDLIVKVRKILTKRNIINN